MAKQKSSRNQVRKKPLINPYDFTLSKGLSESKLTQKELDIAEMPILLYSAIIQSGKSANAAEGTIRKMYAKSMGENAVHGSDSDENALIEAQFHFSGVEMFR